MKFSNWSRQCFSIVKKYQFDSFFRSNFKVLQPSNVTDLSEMFERLKNNNKSNNNGSNSFNPRTSRPFKTNPDAPTSILLHCCCCCCCCCETSYAQNLGIQTKLKTLWLGNFKKSNPYLETNLVLFLSFS